MTGPASEDVDPTDPEYRNIGEGLLDEEMGPSSAMAHLYRGEIHRMKLWRERLDRTTNWAVIVMAAIITWAFSSPNNPHYILLIGVATLSVFLVIEARRYRGYEIWRTRVRILQENVWAYGLDPSAGVVDPDWRAKLSEDYRTPTIKISAEEAIAHRLRRVYLPLFGVLLAAWLVRITAFSPEPWVESAAIGMISGVVILVTVGLFYLTAIIIGCRPRTWHAKGELRAEDLREQRRK
ncbi:MULTISPECIES: DUF2270 domain-containing protein [Halobacteriaceae]|jgi:uncharacterized membrane protein|uniref:DUF2270 domain-containing protein n=1 Tax=Halospeciosus flavus TaxID=3032283 RepID=A0ABD5YX60_9EURY|nr:MULTISPECIES: DUF2270 domain-containing protein [Halobacteriaceae]MCG1004829.1 DUF2270 domain-containing protein [Halobacterium noricense]MUV61327.1 DUF2270 domain-containing protein [Halobacterium sp. CBA1126]UHH26928.1 DUF2270 domain-containing protein [Halobacterium noricense]